MHKLSAYLFLLLLPVAVKATEVPNFSASFDISVAGLPAGKANYTLGSNHDGTHSLQTLSYATGAFKLFVSGKYKLHSTFQVEGDEIIPLAFKDEIVGDEQNLTQSFNWDKHNAHINDEGEIYNLKLNAGTQDVLSYHLKLASSLKNGQKEFSFPVLDNHKLKTYQLKVLETELLDTELGQITTIKLTRLKNKDRTSYVWVAPEFNYIPVQALHIENGFEIKAKITELNSFD